MQRAEANQGQRAFVVFQENYERMKILADELKSRTEKIKLGRCVRTRCFTRVISGDIFITLRFNSSSENYSLSSGNLGDEVVGKMAVLAPQQMIHAHLITLTRSLCVHTKCWISAL